MTKSLSRRFKTHRYKTWHGEFKLTDTEVKRGYAFRPKRACEIHYRVGDIRKAKNKHNNYSYGFKVEITRIAYDKKAKKMKISFSEIDEHKVVKYIDVPTGEVHVV